MAAGISFGRKPKLSAFQRAEALARRGNGETLSQIARSYAVSASMISRLLEEWPCEIRNFHCCVDLNLVTAIAANAQSLFVERVLSNSHSLDRPDPFFSYWVGYARIDPRRDEASTMTSKIRNLLIERYGDHNLSASQVYYVGHRLGLEEKTIHDVVGNEAWLGPIADDLAKQSFGDGSADTTLLALLSQAGADTREDPKTAISKPIYGDRFRPVQCLGRRPPTWRVNSNLTR